MDFDKTCYREFYDTFINYGIIKGSNKIFLIKAGLDGSMRGYQNKYLIIANEINKKYGYTVICSSNPYDGMNDPLIDAFDFIEEYVKEMGFEDYEVYYMGNSNGGYIGARWGYKYPQIKKMLLINAPLYTNFDLMIKGTYSFKGDKVVYIYGSLDPSMRNIRILNDMVSRKVIINIIEGEDHNFSKGIYDFKKLPEDYLFDGDK